MMKSPTVFVLAAMVAGAAAVSAPAHAAQTFADYSAVGTGANIEWTQTAGGTGGKLTTGAGSAVSLDLLSIPGLDNLPATLIYHGSSPAGNPAVALGAYLDQPNLSGNFRFIYTGPGFTSGGNNYVAGDVLLSGHFTGADLIGKNGSSAGNVNDATLTGGTIVYHSPLLKFGPGQRSYSIEMTSITPALGAGAGQSLNDFTAVSTGSFEAGLSRGGNQGVPEPGAWALMMVGVGGLGMALRRKARQATATI
jgi:hypothetical protein